MEQNDGPAVDAGEELAKCLLGRGLVVCVPVHIGQAPEDSLIAQGLGLLQIFQVIFALGRAVIPGHGPACGLLVELRQAVQLLLKGGLVGDGGHVRVVEGVVAHDVPLLSHAADYVGGSLDHIAHHEKGGGGAVLFQCIQNGVGIAILIAAVKGEIDDFLGRVPQKAGVVFGQLLRAGVAHGGLTLLREGQTPVVCGGGDGRRTCGGGQGLLCAITDCGEDQA